MAIIRSSVLKAATAEKLELEINMFAMFKKIIEISAFAINNEGEYSVVILYEL